MARLALVIISQKLNYEQMKQILLIGLGGFLGSIFRYGVHVLSQKWLENFPGGTFIVNILGSFLLGLLIGLVIKSDQALYWFVGIGFCGAFTTFSTFALEGVRFIKNDQWGSLLGYFSVTMIGGLVACSLGVWLGSKFV